jgi:hypothetical protein
MKRTIALLTCLALMIPGAAVASANSTQGSYSPQSGVHNVTSSRNHSPSSQTTQNANASTTEAASTGSLPFTGLDLAALAAGGVVLLAGGLLLRRVSATQRR